MSDLLALIKDATFGSVQEFAATRHVHDRLLDLVFWPVLHNSAQAPNELHARLPPMGWQPALLLPFREPNMRSLHSPKLAAYQSRRNCTLAIH